MMRRRARSENPRVVRKLRSALKAGGGAAEFSSRVFPLREPRTAASVPALRSRGQSKVLVAKAVAKAGVGDSDGGRKASRAKTVRSGKKRLAFSEPRGKPVGCEDEWARVFGGSGTDGVKLWEVNDGKLADLGDGAANKLNGPPTPETDAAGVAQDSADYKRESAADKRFGIVYFRKRLRQECSYCSDAESVWSPAVDTLFSSHLYENTYTRRKKLKVAPLQSEHELAKGKRTYRTYGRRFMLPDSSRNLAKLIGIPEDDILPSLFGKMVLIVLVVSSHSNSSHPLTFILSFVRCWMRMTGFSLSELTAHLLSGSVASVSREYGVHLLPLRWKNDLALSRTSQPSCGLCKIYGSRKSVPLLYLDFVALPSYFKWLHTRMNLGSLYLPCTLMRYLTRFTFSLHPEAKFHKDGFQVSLEKNDVSLSFVNKKQPMDVIIALESVVQDGPFSGSRFQKLRRKRSSSRRHTRNLNPSLSSQANAVKQLSSGGNTGFVSESKMNILPDLLVEPLHLEVPETFDDFVSYKKENDVFNPLDRHENNLKPASKCVVDPTDEKQFSSASPEVKQNIPSACCKANVLITVGDKCWREEGVDVTLDVSSSSDWCIVVKSRGMLRYLHKPQDMKPCFVNQFTHAHMWQGEDGWILEFPERWDWYVFKELHLKCHEHNMPGVPSRPIPIPVIQEVSGYEDYTVASFVRPDDYIRMTSDEVQRALGSEVFLYDMDSADEDWLKKFNSTFEIASGGSCFITEEDFERIICTFEKDAYSNLNDIFDRERVLELYQDFGKADALSSIYNYWIKKRSKRHGALMRVFQGPPLRKSLVHKPHLRKKRPFKSQRTESSGTKQELAPCKKAKHEIAEAAPEDIRGSQKVFQQIQDAERAANKAMETAIQLRNRAQMLMKHAELATYKSFMSLRIAEALQASKSPNPAAILN